MHHHHSHRRAFLKSAAIGGTVLVAGCVGGDDNGGNGNDNGGSNPAATEQPGLDPAKAVDVDRIAADPTDIPDPVDWDEPRHHEIEMETIEVTAEIEPGVTFDYMTYDGQVPGPMVRVRRGDTVHLKFDVPEDMNAHPHNVDFHAVYGPGGGAEHTTLAPGDDTAEIQFRAMYPGVHIYHCAVPNMDHHISAGMFGAILVEPEDGLPEVDREFYFGQHELYTRGSPGEDGHHAFDFDAMVDENPTYVAVNGEAYAFAPGGAYGPLEAEKGERLRVYLANGGPNLTSAWHPIGNVWSDYYRDGSLVSEPDKYVETAPVAPGTVSAGEMDTPVPGPIHLVDHALSRVVHKGRLATIDVQGEPEPDIYDSDP